MAAKEQKLTKNWAVYCGDSAEVLQSLPDGSVHLSIYSPPFATERGGALYNYTSSERDLSNAKTYKEFFEHYEFIVEQVHRLTLPGRITAVHCADIPKKGASIAGYTDFPGDIIRLHRKIGFEYTPRICVWKEPLEVRNRTMSKALAHKQIVEDSTLTNVAAADYLIPFRKRGKNPVPVAHPRGLTDYAGKRSMPADLQRWRGFEGHQIKNKFSHWIWRRYASCFWDDVRLDRVLPWQKARDKNDERHQHPLQLDVIERAVMLWSNPGEVVLSPFMGVGSEVWGAVSLGRKGLGIELKQSYFRQAVKNLEALDKKQK